MPPVRLANLAWAKTTALVGIQLELEPLQSFQLYQRYMVGLHAWFLAQVEQLDPDLSQYLHDGGAEKPFALSQLKGELVPLGNQLEIEIGQVYHWSIYAFTVPVVQCLAQWLTQLPSRLEFRDASFQIRQVTISQPPTTYQKLLRSPTTNNPIMQLKFISPTSFRSKGHSLPFPYPRTVLQSYLRRWNTFSGLPYEVEPFLDWVEATIQVQAYQLQASKVAVAKQGFVTGCTGSLILEATRAAQQEPEALALLHALLKFAAYCGTGYKTPFGLGQTQVEFLTTSPPPPPVAIAPVSPPAIAVAPPLAPVEAELTLSLQDIDALTQRLMAHRKRHGGTRSLTASRTAAEIILRHQAGESLPTIAQKLGKSYSAVKKAYTRARQALQSSLAAQQSHR